MSTQEVESLRAALQELTEHVYALGDKLAAVEAARRQDHERAERYRSALERIAQDYHWGDSPAGALAREVLEASSGRET